MSVHFSNLYGIFKNSSYHVSKEKTSAQRQKRKKTLLGRPIFTLNLYSLVAVLRNQGCCFFSVTQNSKIACAISSELTWSLTKLF